MARRKKAPASTHRAAIAEAAQELFYSQGVPATTMDEIARAAGYSKATLYVYFKNKKEILSFLTLESMKKLRDCIRLALKTQTESRARYHAICTALWQYQEQYPFYFDIVLQEINTDFENSDPLPVETEIFETGEEINQDLTDFIHEGIQSGDFRPDTDALPTVFAFWAMLSGLVRMAANKERYIGQAMNLTRQEFLDYGFNTLYRSIAAPGTGSGHSTPPITM